MIRNVHTKAKVLDPLGLKNLTGPTYLLSYFLTFLLSSHYIFAQQTPVYSQYFINGFVINPALAGSDGTLKYEVWARDYLIGVRESPKTFTASVNARLLRQKAIVKNRKVKSHSGKVGMGGLIYNDRNGLVNRIGFQYSYAYHIDLNRSRLSLGLSGSLSQTRIDASKLDFNDPEPLLKEGFGNLAYAPDASLGVFYTKQEYYIGLTVSNLFQRSIHFGEVDYNYIMYRHYFLLGGTSFDVGRDAYIAPSFLLKATANGMYQGEFSSRISFRDDFWMGVSYRTPKIAVLMAGIRSKNLFIGYAYEYNFDAIHSYSYGAHELNLVYRLGDTARRYRWLIRY
jgi:type IX secretion system PorP/SprF family membrane protein